MWRVNKVPLASEFVNNELGHFVGDGIVISRVRDIPISGYVEHPNLQAFGLAHPVASSWQRPIKDTSPA